MKRAGNSSGRALRPAFPTPRRATRSPYKLWLPARGSGSRRAGTPALQILSSDPWVYFPCRPDTPPGSPTPQPIQL
ncbi:MAG: hypothetical protein OHK005_01440 [Candidatus Methylacidiphilales bacterium]